MNLYARMKSLTKLFQFNLALWLQAFLYKFREGPCHHHMLLTLLSDSSAVIETVSHHKKELEKKQLQKIARHQRKLLYHAQVLKYPPLSTISS